MSELIWFELSPPRDVQLEAVTALLRPLASRPVHGLVANPPLVVFELWSRGGVISWRLGVDKRLAGILPQQLAAHLPGMGMAPARKGSRPELTLAADLVMRGLSFPLRLDTAGAVSAGLHSALQRLHRNESAVVQWMVGPSRARGPRPADFSLTGALGLKPSVKPDATVMRLWREKITEPLFACRGRIGATADAPKRAYTIARGLADSLRLANSAQAGLRLSKASAGRARKLNDVSQPLTWSCLLSAAELATVLGLPVQENVPDDLPLAGGHINVVSSALLAKPGQKESPTERSLGESLHPAQRGEQVVIPERTSLHHLHVVGPTGSGKSTLLANLITADITAGRSVLVIEPKGDLVNDVLARIPASRRNDVVVIEPNPEQSIGFNVLAGDRDQAERRADQIVSLLAELHHGNIGPRSTDVALHALITASRLPDGTLTDVPALLTNPAFRRRTLAQVADPLVLGPWWAWFDGLSEAERAQVVAPLLNKLRAFLSRDALRRMLGQAKPKFTLDELFTKRRIVLVNTNKGSLGPETSSLLGALLLTQLWAAIQRRSAVPPEQRHPVMVTIDETPDYLHLPGVDLGDFFAQARGLGVAVTAAHQHLDQLNATQRAGILANARSRVVFRPAPADAKPLAAVMGDALEASDLLRLRAFEACAQLLVDGQVTRPFSVKTQPLPPWRSDPEKLRRISAERYGVDGAELDQTLAQRWQGERNPDGPVGVKRRRASA